MMKQSNPGEGGDLMNHWPRFLAVSLLLASPQFLAAQQGDAAVGKTVFTKSCAICHGAAGEGKEAIAKALKAEMRHLGSPGVQAKNDDTLRKNVADGVGKMKPIKSLSEKDLSDTIAYLRTLARK